MSCPVISVVIRENKHRVKVTRNQEVNLRNVTDVHKKDVATRLCFVFRVSLI